MFKNLLFVVTAAAMVAGCQPTTNEITLAAVPPANQRVSAYAVLENFIVFQSLASFLGDQCRTLKPRNTNSRATTEKFIESMVRQGYSLNNIAAAQRRLDKNKRTLIAKGVNYLSERGAVAGNLATACAVGLREVEKGTQLGKLLRIT